MNRILVCLSAMLLISLSFVASAGAAVFERDWKTPGDGLLTFDDVNQREWLDLSVSRLNQFPEPRLENAIIEIAPGGLFEGFTWANRDDIRAFAASGGINISTSSIAVNQSPTTQVISLLGSTFERDTPTFIRRSVGFIDETQMEPSLQRQVGALFRININPATSEGFASLSFSSSDDSLDDDSTGLMLYRTIPEPSSTVLAVVGVLAFIRSRYRIALARPKKK